MYAPEVLHYVGYLGRSFSYNDTPIYDKETMSNIDQIYEALSCLESNYKDGYDLWLRVPRGSIEDYGSYEEALACGDVENYAEFEAMWKAEFPDEYIWLNYTVLESKEEGARYIYLGHKIGLEVDPRKDPGWERELSEFSGWLLSATQEIVQQVVAGTYNDLVERELPPQHRTGTIRRAQMWEVWPESKDAFFEGITQEDVAEFLAVGTGKLPPDATRLQAMTSGDFFRFCAMGYAANHYSDIAGKTPLEQYRRHADNRDDGLCDLDPGSPEAFADWYHNRSMHGGHPWEVCRGGNSTHVSLYVAEDEQGWYLKLAGSAWSRTIETVNFFLALHRAGLPVTIMDADILKERLAGTEKIGVAPQGIFPAYCEYLFRGEKIIDFINLPYEDRAEFAKRCVWQPLNQIRLKANGGAG